MSILFKALVASLLGFSFAHANEPADGIADIWPKIPFVRGADLCKYKDAYGQSRTEYMQKMVDLASQIMNYGGSAGDAVEMLKSFNIMYDKNQAMATTNLDVTLEATLKSYVSGYYRNLKPRTQKMSFTNLDDIVDVIKSANSKRDTNLNSRVAEQLDFVAYGTYALAPNCKGDIQVTLHIVGKDGRERSYMGQSTPAVVMSKIASQMFTDFQRTKFPSTLIVGQKTLTLLGGMNGSVDTAPSPEVAESNCVSIGARLPTASELETADSYGDWNGGVSLNKKVWALANGKVYASNMRQPSPIRNRSEVNDQTFLYYCIQP